MFDSPYSHFILDLGANVSEPTGDPDDCILRYRGKIWLQTDRGRSQVGRFEITELGLDTSEHSPLDVLNYEEALSIYQGLFDHRGFSPRVLRLLGEEGAFGSVSTLLIERFEMLPKVRGSGLTPKVLSHLINTLGRNSRIAALIPYPLQFSIGDTGDAFSRRMKYDDIAGDVKSGERKLRKFYSSGGFVRVPGTDLMILDLWD